MVYVHKKREHNQLADWLTGVALHLGVTTCAETLLHGVPLPYVDHLPKVADVRVPGEVLSWEVGTEIPLRLVQWWQSK